MKTFHKDDAFGNDNFGADYSLDATLTATPATASVGAQLRATADLKVNASAFGSRGQIFRAFLTPMSDQTGAIAVNAKLYLAGQEVYSKTYSTIEFSERKLFSNTISQLTPGTRSVTVFGINIRLGAGLYTEGGYVINGQLTVAGFRVNYIPETRVYATVSGAVVYTFYNPNVYSLLYIRFEDVLNLINVKQPHTLDVFAKSCNTIDWKLQVTQSLNSLSGAVTVRVYFNRILNYFPYFIQLDKKFTLARYAGSTLNIPLVAINDSGMPLDFICTSALQSAISILNPPPPPPPSPSPEPPGRGGNPIP